MVKSDERSDAPIRNVILCFAFLFLAGISAEIKYYYESLGFLCINTLVDHVTMIEDESTRQNILHFIVQY